MESKKNQWMKWFLLWMFIPPLFAVNKRKEGMKWKWLIPLLLLSPVSMLFWVPCLLAVLLIVGVCFESANTEVPYEEVTYKTHADICALTEMADFPECTHISSYRDSWNAVIASHYEFKDSLTTTQQKAFTAKCQELNNAYWHKIDSVTWHYERGWNEEYCPLGKPSGVAKSSDNIEIYIRKKGFTILQGYVNAGKLEADKIPNLELPPYEMISTTFWTCGPDYTHSGVIRLKKVPQSSFYNGWEYNEEFDTYTYEVYDEYSNLWRLSSRKGSKIVDIDYVDF